MPKKVQNHLFTQNINTSTGYKYLNQAEVKWPFEMSEDIISDIIKTVKGEMEKGEVDSEV